MELPWSSNLRASLGSMCFSLEEQYYIRVASQCVSLCVVGAAGHWSSSEEDQRGEQRAQRQGKITSSKYSSSHNTWNYYYHFSVYILTICIYQNDVTVCFHLINYLNLWDGYEDLIAPSCIACQHQLSISCWNRSHASVTHFPLISLQLLTSYPLSETLADVILIFLLLSSESIQWQSIQYFRDITVICLRFSDKCMLARWCIQKTHKN